MNKTKEQLLALINSKDPAEAARYSAIVEKSAKITKELIAGFRDKPDWIAEWAAHFACPECGCYLPFDEKRDFKPGGEYVCAKCGNKVSGRWVDGAWVVNYRFYYAARFEYVSVMALLGDEDARRFMIRFLDFYAENYEGFPMHTYVHFCYRGKIMPQMLDEATWCANVLRALYPCMDLFDAEQLEFWKNKLFKPIVDIITDPQHTHCINNHEFKRMCVGGMYALIFGDDAYRYTIDGEYGIRDQIERGYTEEGMWFEGSPSYHYFASEVFTYFCQILADKEPNNSLISELEKIYTVPLHISHDGWNIPSLNDGTYPFAISRIATQLYRAAMATGSKALMDQIERVRERTPEVLNTPAVLLCEKPTISANSEKTAFSENDAAITEALPGTKLAVIRKPVFAVLKSGVVDESHRHDDCLGVTLPPICDDTGTLPYTHPMHRPWNCSASSHNTVAVNGTQPKEVIPTHVEATENSVTAVVDSGWEGVISASRTLTAEGDKLIDITEIKLDKEGVVDWFFHLDGVCDMPTLGDPAELGEGDGYVYFKDVRRIVGDTLKLRAEKDGHSLTLTADISGLEAFAAKSPSNPVCNLRTAVILRYRGKNAKFRVEFSE